MSSKQHAALDSSQLSANELNEILASATAIAAEAAALIMRGFRTRPAVTKKGAIDLVTEFDVASEVLIRDRLGKAFPHHRIVGEESDAGDPNQESRLVWYVDPIDGTTNFSHGHPFFAVSIALCENGIPRVGVIDAPALGVVWKGAHGLGATRNGAPCRVSEIASLDDALCATGFPYTRRTNRDNNFAEFLALKVRTHGVRRCGAASIDLAFVADGAYEAYWEQTLKPWDIAAGALLVRESGGIMSSYGNAPFDVGNGRVVASNGRVHEELVHILAQTRDNERL